MLLQGDIRKHITRQIVRPKFVPVELPLGPLPDMEDCIGLEAVAIDTQHDLDDAANTRRKDRS